MARYQFKQKVVIKETGEVKEVWRAYCLRDGIYRMMDGAIYHESQFFILFEAWRKNTILDVGAKTLKEPAAGESARIANRAIERMINQPLPT